MVGASCSWSITGPVSGPWAGSEAIRRRVLLQGVAPTVVAACVPPVIRDHDHLIARGPPARDERRKHLVHDMTGVVHLLTVVKKTVPHTVERAAVQHRVVQIEPLAQVALRAEKIHIRGRHPVDEAIARHGMKSPVVDRVAFGFITFDVAHHVERRACPSSYKL